MTTTLLPENKPQTSTTSFKEVPGRHSYFTVPIEGKSCIRRIVSPGKYGLGFEMYKVGKLGEEYYMKELLTNQRGCFCPNAEVFVLQSPRVDKYYSIKMIPFEGLLPYGIIFGVCILPEVRFVERLMLTRR